MKYLRAVSEIYIFKSILQVGTNSQVLFWLLENKDVINRAPNVELRQD